MTKTGKKVTKNDGKKNVTDDPVTELVLQALETELGGVQIYGMALECVQDENLRAEWTRYLEQTERHVDVMRGICEALNLDPEQETPGRKVVRHIGEALVQAMQMGLDSGSEEAAELVAAECVVLAETKDHLNWELLGKVATKQTGAARQGITEAYDRVESEEDEHLYHTIGWTRELWLEALGLDAELPPPEEAADVRSAEAAARVRKAGRRS